MRSTFLVTPRTQRLGSATSFPRHTHAEYDLAVHTGGVRMKLTWH